MALKLQYGDLVMAPNVQGPWEDSGPPRRIPSVEIAGVHGEQLAGIPTYGPRIITVHVVIKAASEAAMRARLAAYQAAFGDGSVDKKLWLWDNRFFWARCQSFDHRFPDVPGMFRCDGTVVFRCLDPFCYAADSVVVTLDGTETPDPWKITIDYPGEAFYYPVFRVKASSFWLDGVDGPKITNLGNGSSVQMTGNVPFGNILTMDCAAQTMALATGENMIQYFGGAWLNLDPTLNDLAFTVTGTPEVYPEYVEMEYYVRLLG